MAAADMQGEDSSADYHKIADTVLRSDCCDMRTDSAAPLGCATLSEV